MIAVMHRGKKPSWRALLKHVSGSKEQVSVMVGRGGVAPLPDPVALRLVADGDGCAMLRLDDSGTSLAHTWHPTVEAAKAEAARAFGVADDEWTEDA